MENTSVMPSAIKWGGINGALSLLTGILSFVFMDNSVLAGTFGFLGGAIGIAAIILALKEYRTLNGGALSVGKGTWLGILVSLIGGLIGTIGTIIYSFIDTDLWDNLIESQMKAQEANPDMTDGLLNTVEAMYTFAFSPVGSLVLTVVGAFTGWAIVSVITAAVMKKDPA